MEKWLDPEIIAPDENKLNICKCIDLYFPSKNGIYVYLETVKPIWRNKESGKYLCNSGFHNCLVYSYMNYVGRSRNN